MAPVPLVMTFSECWLLETKLGIHFLEIILSDRHCAYHTALSQAVWASHSCGYQQPLLPGARTPKTLQCKIPPLCFSCLHALPSWLCVCDCSTPGFHVTALRAWHLAGCLLAQHHSCPASVDSTQALGPQLQDMLPWATGCAHSAVRH